MSRKEDMISRLRSRPKDYEIDELDSLMGKCSCSKSFRGKTSGSAIAYTYDKTGEVLKIHSPHPQKELKDYCIKDVIRFLERIGEI